MSRVDEEKWVRPDLVDLIGPEWDRDEEILPKRTLIICSAPRTGSYELCRFLAAAGLGIPHEYFHPLFAEQLKTRWGLTEDPLSTVGLETYIEALRHRRSAHGIFSFKLQYWQFQTFLRNQYGAALFEGACVLHLFRSDVANQLLSFQIAQRSGVWDFSTRQTSEPITDDEKTNLDNAIRQIEFLTEEDAGFRRLFALLGINPYFITTRELFENASAIIQSIAGRLDATVHESALAKMINNSAPYPRLTAEPHTTELSQQLMRRAFTS